MQIPKEGLLIGRSSACDLCLADEFVSAKHCKVFFENEELFIEDLGSSNGTFIDGTEIKTQCATPIVPGQGIQVGIMEMKIA